MKRIFVSGRQYSKSYPTRTFLNKTKKKMRNFLEEEKKIDTTVLWYQVITKISKINQKIGT